ncbi:hypothetical protein DKP78_19260, partial [Enterococcus faecium]
MSTWSGDSIMTIAPTGDYGGRSDTYGPAFVLLAGYEVSAYAGAGHRRPARSPAQRLVSPVRP